MKWKKPRTSRTVRSNLDQMRKKLIKALRKDGRRAGMIEYNDRSGASRWRVLNQHAESMNQPVPLMQNGSFNEFFKGDRKIQLQPSSVTVMKNFIETYTVNGNAAESDSEGSDG